MESEDFKQGKYNTHFIEKNLKFLLADSSCESECEDLALIALFAAYKEKLEQIEQTIAQGTVRHGSDWKQFGRRLAAYRI